MHRIMKDQESEQVETNKIKKDEESALKKNIIKYVGKLKEAPTFYADNQYILQGYRINFNSFKKILRSLFMVHNESVNIWSHIIGAFLVIALAVYVMTSLNYMNFSGIKQQLYQDIQGKFGQIYQEFVEIDKQVNDKINEELMKIQTNYYSINQTMHEQIDLFFLQIANIKQLNMQQYFEILKQLPEYLKQYIEVLRSNHLDQVIQDKWIAIKNKIDSEQFDWLSMNLNNYEMLMKGGQQVSRWPILYFLFTAFVCLGLSATFHLFHIFSPGVYKILLRLDYAGVSFLISGSIISLCYYGFFCNLKVGLFHFGLITLMCIIVFIVSLQDFIHTPKYFSLKSIMYGTLGILATIPMIHLSIKELFINDGDQYSMINSLVFYLLMGASYLLGLFIYNRRCPEKYKPGQFDYCGASHQIWHCCIVISIGLTYYATVINYFTRLANQCPA